MSKHKVTVFIPTYNRFSLLKQAVQSALIQGDEVKVCILDNASTDGTRAWLTELSEKDSRIEVILHPENIGAPKNFEYGFNIATTEYVVPLASDDTLLPGFIHEALEIIESNTELGAVIFRTEVRENGELKAISPNFDFSGYIEPTEHLQMWGEQHYFSWSSILWRNSFLKSKNAAQEMLNFGLASDAWIQFLIFVEHPVYISKECGAVLNVHNGQATRTMSIKSFKDLSEMVYAINNYLIKKTSIKTNEVKNIMRGVARHWNRTVATVVGTNCIISDEELANALELYMRNIYPYCKFENFPFIAALQTASNFRIHSNIPSEPPPLSENIYNSLKRFFGL
jgi:glycosyltransferase involved in cell wall biosynthesis